MDENAGSFITLHSRRKKTKKTDFILMCRDTFQEFAVEAPTLSVMKVFSLLSSMQPHEGGVVIAKKSIAEKLNTTYASVWSACKWLRENGYIAERKVNGIKQFILNSDITTCVRKRQVKNA